MRAVCLVFVLGFVLSSQYANAQGHEGDKIEVHVFKFSVVVDSGRDIIKEIAQRQDRSSLLFNEAFRAILVLDYLKSVNEYARSVARYSSVAYLTESLPGGVFACVPDVFESVEKCYGRAQEALEKVVSSNSQNGMKDMVPILENILGDLKLLLDVWKKSYADSNVSNNTAKCNNSEYFRIFLHRAMALDVFLHYANAGSSGVDNDYSKDFLASRNAMYYKWMIDVLSVKAGSVAVKASLVYNLEMYNNTQGVKMDSEKYLRSLAGDVEDVLSFDKDLKMATTTMGGFVEPAFVDAYMKTTRDWAYSLRNALGEVGRVLPYDY